MGQELALLTCPPLRAVVGMLGCPCPLEAGRPSGARALLALRPMGSRGLQGWDGALRACVGSGSLWLSQRR